MNGFVARVEPCLYEGNDVPARFRSHIDEQILQRLRGLDYIGRQKLMLLLASLRLEQGHHRPDSEDFAQPLTDLLPLMQKVEADFEEQTALDATVRVSQTQEQDHTDSELPGPHLRADKVQGPLVPLVKWLLARSDEAKLAAVVAGILLDGDTENNIKNNGLYEGSIGNELRWDWEQEVADRVGTLDFDEQAVALFIMGINANR